MRSLASGAASASELLEPLRPPAPLAARIAPVVSWRVWRHTAATLPMWSRKPRLPARSAASQRSRRCRRTLVSTSTSAKAAGHFSDRAQAIAACFARLQIRSVRRSRPSPSKTRESSYPRREGGPSPRARQACESAQGCTNERRGPRRCAGRCTGDPPAPRPAEKVLSPSLSLSSGRHPLSRAHVR